jgi:hypothetical protein
MPGQRPANELSNPDNWMAVVGDSGTTGAASSTDIEPNAISLLDLGIKFILHADMTPNPPPPLSDFPYPTRFGMNDVEPATRVIYSREQSDQMRRWKKLPELNLEAKGSMAVDVLEHSNEYMVGRRLGIRGEDIVFVGQDGKKVDTIPGQLGRIYEMKTTTLPPLVILSYTANDFCGDEALTESIDTTRIKFATRLHDAWVNSARYLRPHPKGTTFIILPGLEVANLLTNPELAKQEVYFQGVGKITCDRFRNDINMNGFLTQRMVKGLGGMCATIAETQPSDVVKVERIREIQNEFNIVWKSQVTVLNEQYRRQGIRFIYVEGLRKLSFSNGDLANDCFHPGVNGHAKIADFILRNIFGD